MYSGLCGGGGGGVALSEGSATAVGVGEGGDPVAAVAVRVSLMYCEVPALWRTPDAWAYIPFCVLAE